LGLRVPRQHRLSAFSSGNIFGATIEEILGKIDSALDQAPTRTEKIMDPAGALGALSSIEKELLGTHWFDAQRAIERLGDCRSQDS
jgi:hypothetical protein